MKNFILSLLIVTLCSYHPFAQFEPREDLSLFINVVYNSEEVQNIGLRGNGLGLEWSFTQWMQRTDGDGLWSFELHYRSDLGGFYCQNCSSESLGYIPNGDDLKIQFFAQMADSEEEIKMMGDLYRIPLPQSRVSSYFEKKPSHTFYPYFFSREGIIEALDIESSNEKIGKRKIALYLPPGFKENARTEYDVYFGIDFTSELLNGYKSSLDKIFVDGTIHDAIIIGHGDWLPLVDDEVPDRSLQLTPIEGDDFACNNGTIVDLCNGCIPSNVTFDELVYYMLDGGCGHAIKSGGNADANIDFLLKEVSETVDEYLVAYNSGLTKDRNGKFVLGYSLGGLFTCYALWTRPESFGGGACQSSSFWWPWLFEEKEDSHTSAQAQYYFVNTTLKNHINNRLPQSILIDVGGAEEDNINHMASVANEIFETLSQHPMFQANHNLWYQVYPGAEHGGEFWPKRLWNAFKILSKGRN